MTHKAPTYREPTAYDKSQSNMAKFMQWLGTQGHGPFNDYQALQEWSVNNIEAFWSAVWEHANILAHQPYHSVLSANTMPGAKWFEGSRLNFAENLLRHADTDHANKIAVVSYKEGGKKVETTYAQLKQKVGAFEAFLRSRGVTQGDRVAGVVANNEESLVAMLATTSLGAIWSSASPDFGVSGIIDRFGQIEPKVLVCVNGYSYNGSVHNRIEEGRQLAEKMPSVDTLVFVQQVAADIPVEEHSFRFDSVIEEFKGESPSFVSLPFDHPVYILYSSGTTGVPKCIVHGAGGTLLQHSKELMLHGDLKAEDCLMYFTTCGWMMWNWAVSALVTGAKVVLFDGSPGYPSLDVLWQIADSEGVTHFGTSAKYIGSCRNHGLEPAKDHDISKIRVIFSTGSPLLPEDFDWVYEHVSKDVLLASIAGGTDIVSCFVLGSGLLPVQRGFIQCKGLGMDVKAFDESGKEVVNERGELVCTSPAPSMPVSFWGDDNGEKYKSAYFDKFPGVWAHGDYVMFTDQGSSVIYGRSDSTLNPGGVRIGTAEIYRQTEVLDEIADSLVVGQPTADGDVRVVLFVVLNEGYQLDQHLIDKIKTRIKEGATPRHVPKLILQIDEIPYTRSGKKVEIAVAKILRGEKVDNREAIANPDSLDRIAEIEALFA